MNLSAVTISSNYSDFLAWSLPSAKTVFDRLVVVTSHDDKETQKVCAYYYVECLPTDIMTKDGNFNKGLGINLGIDYLGAKDWLCHFDSDIIFSPRFNDFIRCKKLDTDCIYGIDRLEINSWEQWINFITSPKSQYYPGCVFPTHPVMYRFMEGMDYSPIGYFQLWNVNSKFAGKYPTIYNNAADSDIKFASMWPSNKRILIPELFLYHL